MNFKKIAFILGLAGIAPFLLCTIGVALKLSVSETLLQIQLAYSVIILAFLGGIHWGIAISHENSQPVISKWLLIESVVPVLLGWFLLAIHSVKWQLNGFILLYLLVWLVDLLAAQLNVIAKWFLGLRTLITSLVIILLLLVRLSI